MGNNVRDQYGAAAIFEELASSPAGLDAGKMADAYGSLPGNKLMSADAQQAYIQALMAGLIPTFVLMPNELRNHPDSPVPKWDTKTKYLMPLNRALYGHPAAGVMWEQHCDTQLKICGFREITANKEWPSCYINDEGVMLMVYVDDLKAAGPAEAVDRAWIKIRELIKTTEPEDANQFLGCDHRPFDSVTKEGVKVKGMEYDMESFMKSCVDLYQELAGPKFTLRKVRTPFVEEDIGENPFRAPQPGPGVVCPWCRGAFPVEDYVTVKDSHEAEKVVK